MPRSARLEQEYRAFLARFGLPPFTREVADQVFAEARRGGRQGLDSLAPNLSPEELIRMVQDSGPGMQFVIDRISEEVEQKIVQAGLHLNIAFFAGEFPTGSFNAQACLVADGALLLLNTGLIMFIHKASKLVTHSVRFSAFDDDGKPILESNAIEADKEGLSYHDQVEAFAELALGYLSGGKDWVSSVRRIPFETGAKTMLSAMVVNSCEKFVLAHEYGHAIAGHLTHPRTMVTRTPAGDVEFIAKSWTDEFEADLTAAMLMITGVPRQIQTPADLFPLQFATVGPLFFFALDRLITKVALGAKGMAGTPVVTDHPPSELQMQAVRELFQRFGGPVTTQLADAYVEWVEHVGDDVVKLVSQMLPQKP